MKAIYDKHTANLYSVVKDWELFLYDQEQDKDAYYDGLVTKSCPTLATPWTIAHQVPLSMGFSRWEYWSELDWTWVSCTAGIFFADWTTILFSTLLEVIAYESGKDDK